MARTPTKKTTNNPTNLTLKAPLIEIPVEDNQNHHLKLKDLMKIKETVKKDISVVKG